jgi:hypothetical protein
MNSMFRRTSFLSVSARVRFGQPCRTERTCHGDRRPKGRADQTGKRTVHGERGDRVCASDAHQEGNTAEADRNSVSMKELLDTLHDHDS